MEVFMRNIGFSVTSDDLKVEIARVIHSPEYAHHVGPTRPLNLSVHIFPRKGRGRGGCGVFTVPTRAIGEQFLSEYGDTYLGSRRSIVLGTRIIFSESNKPARPHVVQEVYRTPYDDPRARAERERQSRSILSTTIQLRAVQFGWECRDNVFSIEWEKECALDSCTLLFDDERREFRIEYEEQRQTRIIAIRGSQIQWCSAGADRSEACLYLSLTHPPSFETKPAPLESRGDGVSNLLSALMSAVLSIAEASTQPKRQRWSAFDDGHAEIAAYISIAIRLVCQGMTALPVFRELCGHASISAGDYLYPVERRRLFSPDARAVYSNWVSQMDWPVAFQVEAITRGMLVDLREVVQLRPSIDRMVHDSGSPFTVKFLRHFATQAKSLFWYTDEAQSSTASVQELFARCVREYTPQRYRRGERLASSLDDSFECLHVIYTPTTFRLDGPYPERSNRVIRRYQEHQDCFLRVSFVDETDLQYRFDRDVDGQSFIKRRVGGVLTNGLDIAGRHFTFLAYSQSALKEHAVWFMKEFVTRDGVVVNAESIIHELGRFDPQLMRCPARYGARISQAFTATDASVSAEADEIFPIDDITTPDGKWTFTDGVGTISPPLMMDIWRALSARRRAARRSQTYPRAIQVRFGGSKGMLSVDYRLDGRAICLRPSMIKFEAPQSHIEIARAFYKPGPFYLNRPFIMVLEALGVRYEVFQQLQRDAVVNAQRSVESLERSGRLLEGYGLGASFKFTSVMLSLHRLGLGPLNQDRFWTRTMDFAINHVLRELKHHARIPVPNAWNLVGVADIHGWLEEGEVFGCIMPMDGTGPIYLYGRVLVSRSPTIHPGDVQIAHGIGAPPPGSPFEHESLRNTLVFSIKGNRPLPTYLGGGDLDGDEYRVTMWEPLLPTRTYAPANYNPAKRKLLDRPSTMQDVADFVTEYITSDSLGIIALTWLIIADQSTQGVFDPDCMKLSDLHSDAVDYPKSGQPVPLSEMPRTKFRLRPDWNAPETTTTLDPNKFYRSHRAIGRLFREIDLPAVQTARETQRAQRRNLQENSELPSLEERLRSFVEDDPEDNPLYEPVLEHVSGYINLGHHGEDLVAEMWELFENYRSELQTICADHTLSNAKNAMLTEEEAVVGTIVAKCSQPRKRKDLMSKMREQTATLVEGILEGVAGEDGIMPDKRLERAWVAFKLSALEAEYETFGARSFAWVALSEVFDAIKAIEQAEWV